VLSTVACLRRWCRCAERSTIGPCAPRAGSTCATPATTTSGRTPCSADFRLGIQAIETYLSHDASCDRLAMCGGCQRHACQRGGVDGTAPPRHERRSDDVRPSAGELNSTWQDIERKTPQRPPAARFPPPPPKKKVLDASSPLHFSQTGGAIYWRFRWLLWHLSCQDATSSGAAAVEG
jgi:hypothetical protein